MVSNELVFSYNGTGVAKIKTTGEIVSADDITAEAVSYTHLTLPTKA